MAAPNPVPLYFPYESAHWSELSPDQQAQLVAMAKQADAGNQAQFALIRKEGGCDASKAGRLAGALREKLEKAGGVCTSPPNTFGAQECKEWWRIFDGPPTIEDAVAVSTAQVGPYKISAKSICTSGVTLPTCPKPQPVVIAPVPIPVVPTLPPVVEVPKRKQADMIMAGGLLAACAGLGLVLAKKKGLIK